MSFWSGEKLSSRIPGEGLIDPFDKDKIDCAAYTLSLGGSAYTTGDKEDKKEAHYRGKIPGEWKLEENDKIIIRPGQFAFLLTQESVTIPKNAVAFISIKASHKFAGLINVSGFHVDPGWSGPLIFAVFNAGSQELIFSRGQPMFLLFYADLDRDSELRKKTNVRFEDIPSSMMQKMIGDVPSLTKLNANIEEQKEKIKSVRVYAYIAFTIAVFIAGKMLVFGNKTPSVSDFFCSDNKSHIVVENSDSHSEKSAGATKNP